MNRLIYSLIILCFLSYASSEYVACQPIQETNASRSYDCYYNETKFYPRELFKESQLRDGAVICHVLGMLYMFTALALVCDEFFVPSLEVIIDVFGISDDVAGATFMAAGGSAPEFFTSVIGVFISKSQVGVGTIIGSAVFNVLFVIGMCAVFSKELLTLTWWPLFRDVVFYSCGLCILIASFIDFHVYWYEALILFLWYITYCCFMKFNERAEKFVKSQLFKLPCAPKNETENKEKHLDQSIKSIFNKDNTSVNAKACSCQQAKKAASEAVDKNGDTEALKENGNEAEVLITCSNPECLNNKVTQYPTLALCANTLDPVGNGEEGERKELTDDQATFNDRVKELQRLQKVRPTPRTNRSFSRASLATLREHRFSRSALFINIPTQGHAGGMSGNNLNTLVEEGTDDKTTETSSRANKYRPIPEEAEDKTEEDGKEEEEKEEEKEEPLDLSWPDTCRARLFYIILAPILFPLAFSTPDVRKARRRMLFPITFIMSILWIAVFSYLMVWWTETLGRTIGLGAQPEIMGLTLIAAGTSVPDLITSVIVARKGLGDMAVSSSLGSNLFDICVGLPIPWLIAMANKQIITVDAKGMFCSVLMLFAMLVAIISIIAISKWKMTKYLGGSMFLSYFIYLVIALLMGLDQIPCIFDKKEP